MMTIKKLLTDILSELRRLNGFFSGSSEKNAGTDENDVFMTLPQAAAYLGISPQAVLYRRRKGLITPVYRGGKKGFMLSELNQIKSIK